MSLKISERDRNLIESIKKFFGENNKPRRQKLKPLRLSNPECKEDMIKVMNKVGARSLLQLYGIFAKK